MRKLFLLAIAGSAVFASLGVLPPTARAADAETPATVTQATVGAAAESPAWLTEINKYRVPAGLQAVTANAAWVTGIRHHLEYLAKTPSKYKTGPYASAHTENPDSPYYTVDGAIEGSSSDLQSGAYAGSDVERIDGWLTAPFHAVGMFRRNLQQVAFASTATSGFAGLDVLSGLSGSNTNTDPTLFPGPGMTTNLTRFSGGESPNPLETCRFAAGTTPGLPLIALLPSSPDGSLTASLSGNNGSTATSQGGALCIVDEHTFTTTDTIYGPTGAMILHDDRAVFLIPRCPLRAARYSATITQPGQPDLSWSFAVTAKATALSACAPSAPSKPKLTRAGTAGIRVAWSRPHTTGSAITGYRVTLRAPNGTKRTMSVNADVRHVTFSRLRAHTRYTGSVMAISPDGSSSNSTATSLITARR